MRSRALSITTSLVLITCSCTVTSCAVSVPGDPTAAGIPRTSAKPLPFTPTIKNRTNDRTDGTTFEPCSAYTDPELQALDINPATITDAAQIDSANYRGCHWRAFDYTSARGGTQYSQIVGLEMPLDQYKKKMSSRTWQPDRTAHGRTIAVASGFDDCVVAFRSDESIVTTNAAATTPSPGLTAECDRAIAFASLAISKAP
ncbi:DUF3558 domain-containing protein [Tsukamurella sp. 1534]|uniref:DUF3558 domain-containing protein n=1 Tax=Tsukamurella sp. 1534 TaxID=1151061 RepID=UPI0002FFDDBB|nr:DUF3558 domain-containing protein [Tsukamurella sp. 1534]